jgi:hypothetical protein
MTRIRHPRVAVGNGSYCYAGPECKLHGTAASANPVEKMKQANETSLAKYIQSAKENGMFVKSLKDAGDEAFQADRAAYYSEEDKGFYVYVTTPALQAGEKVIQQIYGDFNESVKNGRYPAEKVTETRKELSALKKEALYRDVYKKNRQAITAFQETLTGEDRLRSEEIRREVRARARDLSTRKPKEKYNRPVMVPENKIDDATMLEYWRCGRKTKFESAKYGNDMIQSMKETDTMSTYQCGYCPKYHIGHGFGVGPEAEALVKAREHWTINAEKANLFAFAKGLID